MGVDIGHACLYIYRDIPHTLILPAFIGSPDEKQQIKSL
jgi:hypothetical protein